MIETNTTLDTNQSAGFCLWLDTHVHSLYSGDGLSSPEELIQAARQRGLQAIALTDHDTQEGLQYLGEIGLYREDGLPVNGFLVIPGVEVSSAEGHLLCLGAWLPPMRGWPAAQVCQEAHQAGALVIAAHPFDEWRCGLGEALAHLPLDGIEVFNAATRNAKQNESALRFAKERGLPCVAGSDAHHHDEVGTCANRIQVHRFQLSDVMSGLLHVQEMRTEYLSWSSLTRKWWRSLRTEP